MTLRIVGVGLHRTGTNSLKLALEELLGEPCHHMYEIFANLDRAPSWRDALTGIADWDALFAGYAATVDAPGAALWRELCEAYPDAVVLLSTRRSADEWWRSVSSTILPLHQSGKFDAPEFTELVEMFDALEARGYRIPTANAGEQVEFYERHNAAVRAAVPVERLVDWQPGDGWGPICSALNLPVPNHPFPHVNSTEAFVEQFSLAVST